ncbi:NAD(P)/FAD-dependent oxidoreductase [Candidimonas nitroreducens]|uniref:FAD-dependent oxidoreductase n=1 Tax=Candidimonas nitroreducens TaxID=683354 RepID=A0A225M302_9BURK|nr:FAD-binding oxidoreductase [Candidimonas nitroreducens]OWT55715.1 FAD-dependent oxidoreductase [Candidimonas nitroreducens]
MKNNPRSHGLWEASAPPPPGARPLAGFIECDVAVVGAGYTGLSAALHLAQGGASVAVIEAVDIGYGGSGRNVGLVNAGMWVMPEKLTSELGQLYGRRLLELLGEAPSLVFDIVQRHDIACEAVRSGTLHCAVGAAGLKEITERARQWRALGAPVHVLDARETARKVGTSVYRGALLDKRAGTIQPLAYARGLARAALRAGAAIYSGSPVARLEDTGSRWRLHTRGEGAVEAPWVIVATNAYSGVDGLWAKLRRELVHLPYFNMATPPLDSALRQAILPERQGAWDTRQVLSSFRFDQAGRLVFGSVGALRGAGSSIHRDWGRRALRHLFPQLADIDFEHEWYGSIGMTANALPRFHRMGRNMISFSGYNGRGIAPGTAFGREMARLVLGELCEEDLPLPASAVLPIKLRTAREYWYEAGSQVVHMFGARI